MPLQAALKILGKMTSNKVLEPGSSETQAVCGRIQCEATLKKVERKSLWNNQSVNNINVMYLFLHALKQRLSVSNPTRQRSTLSAFFYPPKTTKGAKATRAKPNGNRTAKSSKQSTLPFTRVSWYSPSFLSCQCHSVSFWPAGIANGLTIPLLQLCSQNVEPVGKRFLLAVDVSTSLSSIVPGTSVSTAVAAAAISMVRWDPLGGYVFIQTIESSCSAILSGHRGQ